MYRYMQREREMEREIERERERDCSICTISVLMQMCQRVNCNLNFKMHGADQVWLDNTSGNICQLSNEGEVQKKSKGANPEKGANTQVASLLSIPQRACTVLTYCFLNFDGAQRSSRKAAKLRRTRSPRSMRRSVPGC